MLISALLALFATIAMASCGSSTTTQPEASPAPSDLLTPAKLKEYPQGSVERSFFEYWSALQFQSWAEAASYFDPRFRSFLGTTRIIGAKKLDASTFPLTKPEIARVSSSDLGSTIFYSLRLSGGTKELASITWRKNDGSWQIVYDSRLDPELNQLARDRVELEKNGKVATSASELDPPAVRAGERAAQLQARFLEQELNAEAPQ